MDRPLQWSESFSVGHSELDEEHRRLVADINDICHAYRAGQPPKRLHALLNSLATDTKRHLAHEDAVLREFSAEAKRPTRAILKAITDAAVEQHIAAHDQSFAQLGVIMRAAGPKTPDAASVLCAELTKWFLDHAIKYDSHLKTIFQAM